VEREIPDTVAPEASAEMRIGTPGSAASVCPSDKSRKHNRRAPSAEVAQELAVPAAVVSVAEIAGVSRPEIFVGFDLPIPGVAAAGDCAGLAALKLQEYSNSAGY
jgi:hypothetical protein